MIKFLVYVDDKGKINQIKWCEPPGLMEEGDSIQEIFVEESRPSLLTMLQNISAKGSDSSVITQISIEGKLFPVTLFGLTLEGNIIILGFDSGATDFELCQDYITIYNDFVNKVREEFSNAIKERELSIRLQFEEIQKLNNELINTRRKLEKAYVMLNKEYSDLQSQFVKDALTGVVSRHQYWIEMERIIEENPGKCGVFTFIDIDDFKFINDTYGHAAGDKFLVEFARRLQEMPLPNTIIIRIAGDEFAIFTYGLDQVDDSFIENIWTQIKNHVLSAPIKLFDFSVPISISAGMALYGIDTDNIKELIEYADFAMYRAKSQGKGNYYRFDKDEFYYHKMPDDRLQALRKIVEERDIYHVYQPIVDTWTGKVFAYAVLMRTDNINFKDTRDLLQVALEKGRYTDLNRLSFEVLINSYSPLEEKGKKLFITQGPYPLFRDEFMEDAPEAFLKKIVLEITESFKATLEDMLKAREHTREMGCQLAMSNFGTGYANDLMVLSTGPDFIKIARELVRDIHENRDRQKLLRDIVHFAHQKSSKVVAEGIEKKEELQTLVKVGIDYVQGFYVGEPEREPGEIKSHVKKEIKEVNPDENK